MRAIKKITNEAFVQMEQSCEATLQLLMHVVKACLLWVKNILCSCWGESASSVKCTIQYIIFFFTLPQAMDWNGKGVNTVVFVYVSLLPSMDYLWAGDDRSAGLQSGWLGSGRFLPRFLTHPRASKAIAHSLAAIPTLRYPHCQMWKSDFYLAKWYYSVCTLEKQFTESWN